MLAAALALLASLSWGTSDFLAGLQARRSTVWTAALAGQLVSALALIALLAVLAPARPAWSALAAPLLGGAVGGLAVLLQYRALALADMSVVSPIIAGAALVPVLWGIAAGERPGALQLLGVALTAAGIVLISRRRPEGACDPQARGDTAAIRQEDDPGEHRRRERAGILAAAGAALAFGLFLVCLDYGGRGDPYWTVAVTRTAALVTLVAAAVVIRPAIRLRRAAVPTLVVVGLLIAAANVSFTAATTYGYLSLVAVLGWLNPAVTIAWARVLLGERLRPVQIVAALLVFAGIVGVTLG